MLACRRTRRWRSPLGRCRSRAHGRRRERRSFSVRPSTSKAAPREEELAALGIELAQHAEALVGGKRLGLDDRGAAPRFVLDERELLEASDVEEGGGVGRVEDLVAGGQRTTEQPVEVALRLRAQEQLWLLDQEHDPAFMGATELLDRVHECSGGRRRRRQSVASEIGACRVRGIRAGLMRSCAQSVRPRRGRREPGGVGRRARTSACRFRVDPAPPDDDRRRGGGRARRSHASRSRRRSCSSREAGTCARCCRRGSGSTCTRHASFSVRGRQRGWRARNSSRAPIRCSSWARCSRSVALPATARSSTAGSQRRDRS